MHNFRERRAAASQTWCQQQAASPSPAFELGRTFEADGSFPIFGPLIAISITPFLHSDFGPCPAIRGCHFPDSVEDTGGWDSNYHWAELLQLSAGGVLWWTCWRHFFPDTPVQWPAYASPEVIIQLGGQIHLAEVSRPDFQPQGPRYPHNHILTLVHGVCPTPPSAKAASSLAATAAQSSTPDQDRPPAGSPPLPSSGRRFPPPPEDHDQHHVDVVPCNGDRKAGYPYPQPQPEDTGRLPASPLANEKPIPAAMSFHLVQTHAFPSAKMPPPGSAGATVITTAYPPPGKSAKRKQAELSIEEGTQSKRIPAAKPKPPLPYVHISMPQPQLQQAPPSSPPYKAPPTGLLLHPLHCRVKLDVHTYIHIYTYMNLFLLFSFEARKRFEWYGLEPFKSQQVS